MAGKKERCRVRTVSKELNVIEAMHCQSLNRNKCAPLYLHVKCLQTAGRERRVLLWVHECMNASTHEHWMVAVRTSEQEFMDDTYL